MAKETAEQKLLKALQKKTGGTADLATKKSVIKKGFKFSLSIFDINKILLVGIIVCAVILILQLRSGMSLINQEVDFSDQVKTSVRQKATPLPQSKTVKFYIDSFGKRNIFKPYDISLGTVQGQPNLVKRLAKYKLVGVSWLDLPESASIMIEDTQTKATYFLKTSEQLEGVTVKTIYTDRVVFSYENEETTIKL
ncbi:MAG: hypothetical protein HQL15_10435 [Candidatus Omnitrophica bacterium]|nr:hypothetical protein [Candidatus Omnitrophota bacterium]